MGDRRRRRCRRRGLSACDQRGPLIPAALRARRRLLGRGGRRRNGRCSGRFRWRFVRDCDHNRHQRGCRCGVCPERLRAVLAAGRVPVRIRGPQRMRESATGGNRRRGTGRRQRRQTGGCNAAACRHDFRPTASGSGATSRLDAVQRRAVRPGGADSPNASRSARRSLSASSGEPGRTVSVVILMKLPTAMMCRRPPRHAPALASGDIAGRRGLASFTSCFSSFSQRRLG